MNLTTLAGNEVLKRQLSMQTARRGLSHAYILSGPVGSGRHTLARLLAAAFVCSGEGEQPCLHCPGCRKAMGDIHPDVIRIGSDGKDITVAQVRALRADAYIRPNEAQRKVYLLENAHTMNDSAQNAMLKLLEEGPAYAAFLLVTDNAAALLATVRSRCETLCLSPVTQAQAEAVLAARYPALSQAERRAAAQRCEGLLGRAVTQLEGTGQEEETSLTVTACALLEALTGSGERTLAELCVPLEKWDRDRFSALLDELILLLRDALVSQSGGPLPSDPDRVETVRQTAACPAAALLGHIRLCEQLRTACGFNVGVGHLCGWLCAGLYTPSPQ